MWAKLVVLDPPSFDLIAGIFKAQEPGDVEALISERTVEGFDKRIIRGFAGARV